MQLRAKSRGFVVECHSLRLSPLPFNGTKLAIYGVLSDVKR